MVDSIVDELEKMPEVAAYYSVWNDLRDTLEGYYKSKPRQHNPLSQQKEFRAIKNAIIQEAERLRQQMEQESSQGEEPSAEETSRDASTNPTLADENTSSPTSHSVQLPSEYLLNSTVRLFHQMGKEASGISDSAGNRYVRTRWGVRWGCCILRFMEQGPAASTCPACLSRAGLSAAEVET